MAHAADYRARRRGLAGLHAGSRERNHGYAVCVEPRPLVELLVTDDHVDMRGWTLVWEEVKDSESGSITLSGAVVT